MADQTSTPKPDAFKQRMADAKIAGRPELAHQSLGRLDADFLIAVLQRFTQGRGGFGTNGFQYAHRDQTDFRAVVVESLS